jgi:deazaflavin-dependent oxidoreductase (nitroreductase family)
MPNDIVLKTMNTVHRGVQKITGGRAGWKMGDMPIVELTTIGRRSGEPRTVLLSSPLVEGSTIVLVASRGGDDRHPDWFLNLRDHPEVDVRVGGGPKVKRVTRIATPEERARMWPLLSAKHKNYANYQTKTDREIPLVLFDTDETTDATDATDATDTGE